MRCGRIMIVTGPGGRMAGAVQHGVAEPQRAPCGSRSPAAPVHAADEVGDESVGRALVDLERRAELFEHAAPHHGDAVADRQRLRLVMRDEDGGDAEALLDVADLVPHLLPQLGVEVATAARPAAGCWARSPARGPAPRAAAARRTASRGRRLARLSSRTIASARRTRRSRSARGHAAASPARRRRCRRRPCAGTARSSGRRCPCRACAAAAPSRRARRRGCAPPSPAISPPIMRSVVVLPQPEGPSSADQLALLDRERQRLHGRGRAEALLKAAQFQMWHPVRNGSGSGGATARSTGCGTSPPPANPPSASSTCAPARRRWRTAPRRRPSPWC